MFIANFVSGREKKNIFDFRAKEKKTPSFALPSPVSGKKD